MELKVRVEDGARVPSYAMPGDAGMDLAALEGVAIEPGETVMVRAGVHVAIPEGYFGAVFARSGMASKRMLAPVNGVGVIDSGYRGEVMVPLHNYASPVTCRYEYGAWPTRPNRYGRQEVSAGERIAQLVVIPFASCDVVCVDELDATERGTGGFGSTGCGSAVGKEGAC